MFLVGGGDPLLSSEWYPTSGLDRMPAFNTTSLDELARTLVAAGVTQIAGVVRGDDSRYDDERTASSWGGDVSGIEAGPYDALLVNDARVLGDEQRADDPSEAGSARVRADPRRAGDHGHRRGRNRAPPVGPPSWRRSSRSRCRRSIAEMLTNSDNNTAEMMLKEIGLAASGAGTRQAGRRRCSRR